MHPLSRPSPQEQLITPQATLVYLLGSHGEHDAHRVKGRREGVDGVEERHDWKGLVAAEPQGLQLPPRNEEGSERDVESRGSGDAELHSEGGRVEGGGEQLRGWCRGVLGRRSGKGGPSLCC